MDASRPLITFKPADIRFTYRVGGILLQHEHVLCQSAGEEGFWFLPGGRAEVGEPARVTLLREMQEELGEAVQIERLLYVVENFFRDANDAWHELGLYFLLSGARQFVSHSKPRDIHASGRVGQSPPLRLAPHRAA